MLSRMIQFALTQRLLVLVLTALLIGAGGYAFKKLPIDAFPDVSSTQVKIIVKAPGMTPEEVEARITAPIEVEMLGLPHQAMLRSVAKYGLTDITVDFEDGTDIYWARQQVAERLTGIWESLPSDVSGGIAPMTTPLGEMFMFTVEGDNLSLEERRSLLDWVIRPQLRTVPGVADVNALGGLVRTFEVVPDNARMYARGVTLDTLEQALLLNNRNDGAGRLGDGEESLLVRAEGRFQTLDDVRGSVIKSEQGMPVRVNDVAQVRFGALTRYGAVTRDGKGETVEGLVLGLRGANAQQVVNGVRARLAEIQPSLPKGVTIQVFYDRSSLVERAVGTVSKALIEAIVLVVILLVLFLGNLRAALTVALALPLAALVTFILMGRFNMSANLMSLGGLSIAIGMLVDAAVVVVENTVTRLQPDARGAHLPRLHRVFDATREVATPVAAGMLIIALTFLPLLTLEGLEGKLFGPVALTIVFALGASLLLSLTLIPVLASFLLRSHVEHTPWLMRQVDRIYRPLLDAVLARPRRALLPAVVALVLGVAAYLGVGKSFMPTMDEGDILVQIAKSPAISLQRSAELDLAVGRAIKAKVPEVDHVVARVGSDELGLDPMGLNETDMFLKLKPKAQWRNPDKAWLAEEIRKVLHGFPGMDIGFTQPIEMRVSEMLTGSRGDLAIKIFGPDLATLGTLAHQTAVALEKVPGAQDILTQTTEGVDYLQVVVDPVAAGRNGLAVADVQDELRAQIDGMPAGIVIEPGRRTPILVRGGDEVRMSAQRFRTLRVALPGGGDIPLSAIATLKAGNGPVKVGREQGSRYALVQSNVDGRDLVGFVEEAKAALATAVKLPPGYRMEWGGQFENQQRAAARLGLVVPIALAAIFVVLFLSFGSLRQALLILGNIPFALVGGLMALWLSGEYLSVPASVGFIALLGIAVLNGLVLVTCFNQLHDAGLKIAEVVRRGALQRVRPVLMTASITALGLVPLLLASGPGSEIQRPLAIVVIGGLVTSTALTLLLLPILYQRYGIEPSKERA